MVNVIKKILGINFGGLQKKTIALVLLMLLASMAFAASPDRILKHVRENVDAFVKYADQFDDLTMLCFEYSGPQEEENK